MKTTSLLIIAILGIAFRGNCQPQNLLADGQKIVSPNHSKDYRRWSHESIASPAGYFHSIEKPYSFVDTFTNETSDLIGYLGVSFGLKFVPLKIEKQTVFFQFHNLSPSGSDLSSTQEVKGRSHAINLDVSIQRGIENGHHLELGLGGLFGGALTRFYGEAGYGWNFAVGPVTVRPVLNVAYRKLEYFLGQMSKSGPYIEVNEARFYSNVYFSAVSHPLALIPRVDIPFRIGNAASIKFSAGYHLTVSKGKPFILIESLDENDEYTSLDEQINDANVNFLINGIRVQRLPIGLDGWQFGVGVSFNYH